jgi:CRISPR/Cas system-associated exonuclease Cas4 (RecB family)
MVKHLPTFEGMVDGKATYGRPYISASALLTYIECAYKWYTRYVLKERRPLSWKAEFGNVFHSTIEDDLNHHIQTGSHLSHGQMYERYAIHLGEKIAETGTSDDLLRSYGSVEAAVEALKTEGNALIRLYLNDPNGAPSLRPIHAELPFRWRVDDDYDVRGKMDEVDHGNGEGEIIHDFKTSGSDRELDAIRWLAGTVYAAARYEMTGELPARVKLIRFNRRARQPFIDTAESERTLEQIDDLKRVVRTAVSLIQRDVFPPDGLTKDACRWCDYRRTCAPKQAYDDARMVG